MYKLSRMSRYLILVGIALVLAASPAAAQDGNVSLEGVIDFHTHAGPDSRPRSMDDIEAAQQFKAAGLRGMVLKNHFTMTGDRAALAMAQVDGLEIFGGVVLNRSVGGINPEMVRQMVAFEGGRGKVVWLPTFDAEHNEYRVGLDGNMAQPTPDDPVVRVVEDGEPVPALVEVLSLIGEHDLVLATGHVLPDEVFAMLPAAKAAGVRNILITHPFHQHATIEQMQRLAAEGAIMELDWFAVHRGSYDVQLYVDAIRDVGAEHFLITSDFGQRGNPTHVEGLRAFIAALQAAGVSEADIDLMARTNPARLLGLD
jgi:hypothetical protein